MTRSGSLLLPAAGHCVPMPSLSARVGSRGRAVAAGTAVTSAVRNVLRTGVRGLDVAPGSEEAAAAALVRRADDVTDVFVTATVPSGAHGAAETAAAVGEAARNLRRPVLDLVLLEGPARSTPRPLEDGPARDAWVESWRTLLDLRDGGRIRAVGTRTADRDGLALLMDSAGEAPAVNQVEVHPYRPRRRLRAFHAQHGIATRARHPLAPGTDLVHDPVVTKVAISTGATPAQVLLAWQWHHHDAALSTAQGPRRLAEHAASVDVHLTDAHVAELDALGRRANRPHGPVRARRLSTVRRWSRRPTGAR